jgi:RNA polymerase sigma-70 factor (ECF subfamily)
MQLVPDWKRVGMSMTGTSTFGQASAARFAATRWSVVLAAGGSEGESRTRQALEELARSYWFPLYAYLRRRGYGPQAAEDLVQGFFARLLEHEGLASVDQGKGRFRSFLLASLKHFAADEQDKRRAQKRGAGVKPIALDGLEAEARYAIEPVDEMTPERVFERRWAWAVLDQALCRLREQYCQRGQGKLFEVLKGTLTAADSETRQKDLARELDMSENALAVAGHRLRRRYRELLREEIAQTVSSPDLIDEEIGYLLGCL